MQTTFDQFYATDETLVEDGAPMSLGLNANGEEVILYIGQEGNEKHNAALRKRQKRLENARHDEKAMMAIRCEIIAEAILLTWKGVLDQDGAPVEPSYENRVAILKKYKKLLLDILEFSGDMSNYRPAGIQEDTEGN